MSKVQIVRLTSGEEIICDLQVSGDVYVLKTPMVIIPTGEGNIGIARWMPYADAKVVQISKKFVMFTIDPVAELANQYSQLNSKIIVPEIKQFITG